MDLSGLASLGKKVSKQKDKKEVVSNKEKSKKITDLSFLEGSKPKYDLTNTKKIVYCGCDRCKDITIQHIISTVAKHKETGVMKKIHISVCRDCNLAYRVLF